MCMRGVFLSMCWARTRSLISVDTWIFEYETLADFTLLSCRILRVCALPSCFPFNYQSAALPQAPHSVFCDMSRLNLVKSAIFQKWFFWCFFIRNVLARVDLIIKAVLEFLSDLLIASLRPVGFCLRPKWAKMKEKIKECGIIQKLFVTIVD